MLVAMLTSWDVVVVRGGSLEGVVVRVAQDIVCWDEGGAGGKREV